MASLYRNRFIVIMPSFDTGSKSCANCHLNVAVSRSSDPKGSWYRYRVTLPDAYTDDVTIGFSDTKVVFAHNEWDLSTAASDCRGSSW